MSATDGMLSARAPGEETIRALIALDAEIDRTLVEALVSRLDGVSVVDYIDLARAPDPGQDGSDVLLIACVAFTPAIAEFAGSVREHFASRPIIVLAPETADGFVANAFEAGADDVLTVPAYPDPVEVDHSAGELMFSVEKASARRRGALRAVPQPLGRLICLLGLKGGSGKTLASTNLGVALATAGHSVAMVDLDLQFGDLGLAMGLVPERTIYDLVRSGGSLDAEKLSDFLTPHSSGARVLLSPVRPDQASLVTPEFVRAVLKVLQQMHEFVIVDTPPAFTADVIAAVDASTDVLIVSMLDSLALKNTKLGLETLHRMEYDRRHIRLLLNRANTDVGIERQDLLAVLGTEFDVRLPSHRDITRSVNRGEPLALDKRSPAAKVFHELAQFYIEEASPAPEAPPKRRRRRRRLFRRGR